MRCKACNVALRGSETSSKDDDGQYLDLCGVCKGVSYQALERESFRWDIGLTEEVSDDV